MSWAQLSTSLMSLGRPTTKAPQRREPSRETGAAYIFVCMH